MLREWEDLPESLKNDSVKEYYELLDKKRISLFFKRIFDILVSFSMLLILLPVLLIIAIAIKFDSQGPVFFRQVRVTQYGDHFKIFKFRTMVSDAENLGTQITLKNDKRITRVGEFIRKSRLDELPQLIDILRGKMTFVGTRPEIPKYVSAYTNEMMATLLLPAGVTSEASISYKDEALLLEGVEDVDKVYIEEVLPRKMAYNLKAIREFSFLKDISLLFKTVIAVLQ